MSWYHIMYNLSVNWFQCDSFWKPNRHIHDGQQQLKTRLRYWQRTYTTLLNGSSIADNQNQWKWFDGRLLLTYMTSATKRDYICV